MKKIILDGLVIGLVISFTGFFMDFLFSLLFPAFDVIYTNQEIFLPMDGSSPLSYLFFLYPFALGIALSWLYHELPKKMRNWHKFSLLYFAINVFPLFLINVGSFNFPVIMIFSWSVMSFVNGLVAVLLLEKFYK